MRLSRIARRLQRSGALKWAGILGASFVATAAILTVATPNRSQRPAPEVSLDGLNPAPFNATNPPLVTPSLDLKAVEADPNRLASALYAAYLQDLVNTQSVGLTKANPFSSPHPLTGLDALDEVLVTTPIRVQSPAAEWMASPLAQAGPPALETQRFLTDDDFDNAKSGRKDAFALYMQAIDAGLGDLGLGVAGTTGTGQVELTPFLITLGAAALIGGIVALSSNQVAQADTPNEIPIPTPALLPGLLAMGAAALRRARQEKTESIG